MSPEQIADIAVANLTSPPALAFLLGLLATSLLGANLKLPGSVYTALSMYLLLAIGIKGGVALRSADLSDLIAPSLAAIALGVAIPFIVFHLLRVVTPLRRVDRGAMAAHYGSTSLVTFTAAIALLELLKIPFEGYVATLLTIMEIPGIIVGLMLARTVRRDASHASRTRAFKRGQIIGGTPIMTAEPVTNESSEPIGDWKHALREVITGPSVLLLAGGLVLGSVTGPRGYSTVEPLFAGLFVGVLTLFLLHLGCVAGAQLRHIRVGDLGVVVFALVFPLFAGALGVLAGTASGLSVGGAALFGVLCASASYIAAPAAVSIALPKANEGLCLTASLGITFPFNLAIGIPLLITLSEMVA